MNTASPPKPLPDLIAAVGDQLTPSEQVLARLALDDPTVIAFGTASGVARRLDVSSPTVVRFARKLGFEGYSDLQAHIQASLAHSVVKPSDRIRSEPKAAMSEQMDLLASLEETIGDLTPERIAPLTRPLVTARNVFVLSGETSKAGGHALASGLAMLRRNVLLVDADSAGRTLNDASAEDVAVVLDFYRYRRAVHDAVVHLKTQDVQIVSVTDSPLSPYAAAADAFVVVSVPAVGPFDSSIPAVAVAELMVASLARELGPDAIRSIDRTESAWDATSTFLG